MGWRSSVLALSPWAFYPLTDAWPEADASGNGRAAATLTITGPGLDSGKASLITGDSGVHPVAFPGFGRVTVDAPSGTGARTFVAWFEYSSTPTDWGWLVLPACVCGCYRPGPGSGTPFVNPNTGGSGQVLGNPAANVEDGGPHMLVWRLTDATHGDVWIDGVQTGSSAALGQPGGGSGWIGGDNSPNTTANGWWQGLAIWDRALTGTEIAALYAAGSTSDTTDWSGSASGSSSSSGHAVSALEATGSGASSSAGHAAGMVLPGITARGASVSTGHAAGIRTFIWHGTASGGSVTAGIGLSGFGRTGSASGGSVSAGQAAAVIALPTVILRPYLLGAGSYNGIAWGAGTPLRIVKHKGLDELPPMRVVDQDRAAQQGSRSDRDLYGPRTITVTFQVLAPDNAGLRRLLYQIERAWQADATDRTLVVFDGARTITGRIRQRAFDEALGGRDKTSTVDVMWWCGDPFYYDVPQLSVELAPSLAQVVRHDGNVEAPVRITLAGPATNPQFSNDTLGRLVWVNVALLSGDTLALSSDDRTVLVNGQPNADLLDPLGRNWWDLPPGANQVRYTSDSNDPSERAVLSYGVPRV